MAAMTRLTGFAGRPKSSSCYRDIVQLPPILGITEDRMWRRHRPFIVLLLVFVIGAAVYQILFPFMEGVDEDLHFNYVNLLRNENRLPDRQTVLSDTMRQESGQPPLTYWVAARVLDLLHLPRYTDDARLDLQTLRNPW